MILSKIQIIINLRFMTTHWWLWVVLAVLVTISQCEKCGKDDV
jgi:hypothetical protein